MKKILALVSLCFLGACASGVPTNIDNTRVYFAFDSAKISESYRAALSDVAVYMKAHDDAQIRIAGNASASGPAAYNAALGALRAGNVAHAIAGDGVDIRRIETVSFGEGRPISKLPAENRNATITIK